MLAEPFDQLGEHPVRGAAVVHVLRAGLVLELPLGEARDGAAPGPRPRWLPSARSGTRTSSRTPARRSPRPCRAYRTPARSRRRVGRRRADPRRSGATWPTRRSASWPTRHRSVSRRRRRRTTRSRRLHRRERPRPGTRPARRRSPARPQRGAPRRRSQSLIADPPCTPVGACVDVCGPHSAHSRTTSDAPERADHHADERAAEREGHAREQRVLIDAGARTACEK